MSGAPVVFDAFAFPVEDEQKEQERIALFIRSLQRVPPDMTPVFINRELKAALAYAAKGYHVFPCWQGSKKPATRHGYKDASCDPDVVKKLFDRSNLNVAIATGASRLVVIDVDGEVGVRSMEALRLEGPFPETYTVKTRSGGKHYYFTAPAGVNISNSTCGLAPGIDVRADGGHVVAPPSFVGADSKAPEGSYTVAIDGDVQALPTWLAERLVKGTSAGQKPADSVCTSAEHHYPETTENIARIHAGLDLRTSADGWSSEQQWFLTMLEVRSLRDLAGWQDTTAWKLFDNWSRGVGGNYDEEGNRRRWDHRDPPVANPRTYASILQNVAEPPVLAAPASRFRLYKASDLAALPPQTWHVKGLLPHRGLASIYGASGSGKTFIVLDLALHITLGMDWFGRRTTPCPVIYVALEGTGGIRNRILAWEQHHGASAPDAFRVVVDPVSLIGDCVGLSKELQTETLTGGVIFIDTLNQSAPGKDENSSEDMGEIIAAAKTLQSHTGSLVVLVHHTGKDASRGLRGHSSLHAALDAAIEVRKSTAAGREWVLAKSKDSEGGASVPFMLKHVVVDQDPDGADITSCVVEHDVSRVILASKPQPTGAHQIAAYAVVKDLLRRNGSGQVMCTVAVAAVAATLNVQEKRRNERAKLLINTMIKRGVFLHVGDWLQLP
jgi:hypothetical protein